MARLWTARVAACNHAARECVRTQHPGAKRERIQAMPQSAPDPARDREDADRRTAGLAAIVVVLLLLIGGLLLTQTLRKKSQLEDCLMAGRRDCDRLLDGR